jgi:hypothetical protein
MAIGFGFGKYPEQGGKSLSVSSAGAMFANSAWNVAADGWNEFRPDDPYPMPKSPIWWNVGPFRGIFPP